MSSEILSTPSIQAKAVDILYWYCSLAELTSTKRRLQLYKPLCVRKVVIWRDSGLSSSWCYPHFKSNLMKTLKPFMLCSNSSTVGMGHRPRIIASFARLISMQRQILPSAFGMITTGFTHGVRPSTSSMMSQSNHS